MSKLDGNNRWGTKWALPELAVKYEQRNDPKFTGRPTPEELTLIRNSVILPHMLTMADAAERKAEKSKDLFKNTCAALIQIIMDRMTGELTAIKRQLRERSIKVVAEETRDDILYHRYWCRGHEDQFLMTREVVRAEISRRFGRYEAGIIKLIEGAIKDGQK